MEEVSRLSDTSEASHVVCDLAAEMAEANERAEAAWDVVCTSADEEAADAACEAWVRARAAWEATRLALERETRNKLRSERENRPALEVVK